MIVDGMLCLPSTINQRPSTFLNFFDAALHVKVGFGHVVVFAVQDFLEAFDGVRHRHLFARSAGENLRYAERATRCRWRTPKKASRKSWTANTTTCPKP